MRLEKLEIKNYRQYRDVKFDFAHIGDGHDMHIVLGRNGTGKTNMLNAITWCLYGDESHLGDQNMAIDKLNTEAIAEARNQGKEKVTLSVELLIKTDDPAHPKMSVSRSVTYYITLQHIQAQEEKLEVQEFEEDSKNWKSFLIKEDKESTISRHIPQQINEYVFFDGEQLEKYFQGANRERLKQGINNLTQVSLVSQSINAIARYKRTELEGKINLSGYAKAEELAGKVSEQEDVLAEHTKTLDELKEQRNDVAQRINELKDQIRNNDKLGEKKADYQRLEENLQKLEYLLTDKKRDLMIFIRSQYILFGLYTPIIKFYKYIKEEEMKGNLPPQLDKGLLQKILSEKCCSVCGQSVEGNAEKHVQELLDKINVSSVTAAQLNRALPVLRMRLDEMKAYPQNLKVKLEEIKRLNNELEVCEKSMVSIKRYLESISGHENILEAINEKDRSEGLASDLDRRIGRQEALKDQAAEKLDKLNVDLSKVLRENESTKILSQQRDYLERCIRVLSATRDDITAETRKQLEEETFDIFQSLIWKKDAFTRIEIDEDYTFKLYDRYGNQTLGACSAAERALLALSFTLALQHVSGHSSLLYIDTPIGRVDTENRENFMKILLDVSKDKQVILTFTPTEYDMTVSEILKNKTASFVKLKSETGQTSIENN